MLTLKHILVPTDFSETSERRSSTELRWHRGSAPSSGCCTFFRRRPPKSQARHSTRSDSSDPPGMPCEDG
jgi:hypothetical protein